MEPSVTLILLLSVQLALAAALASSNGKYYCAGLKPIKNIPANKMSGNWITLNELLFKDGVPAAPLPGETIRHNQCIRHQVAASNSSVLSWAPFFSFARGHETPGAPFTVANKPNGRWKLHQADGKAMQGGRMLILAAETETYLVRAMCFPEARPSTGRGEGKSGKAERKSKRAEGKKGKAGGGEGRAPLVLKAVSVESRRQPGQEGRGALDAEQMIVVKSKIAKILGLKEFKPAQFGLYC